MTADPGFPAIKDRKQEVVEILGQDLLHEFHRGKGGSTSLPTVQRAEALYDRIAPLMVWEFPEKGVRGVIRRIIKSAKIETKHISIDGYTDQLKRLFEGNRIATPTQGEISKAEIRKVLMLSSNNIGAQVEGIIALLGDHIADPREKAPIEGNSAVEEAGKVLVENLKKINDILPTAKEYVDAVKKINNALPTVAEIVKRITTDEPEEYHKKVEISKKKPLPLAEIRQSIMNFHGRVFNTPDESHRTTVDQFLDMCMGEIGVLLGLPNVEGGKELPGDNDGFWIKGIVISPPLVKDVQYLLRGVIGEPIPFTAGDTVNIMPTGCHAVYVDESGGTCQTCRGEKEVTISVPDPFCKAKVECPDCKGTGECQHRRRKKYSLTHFGCCDCGHYIFSERSGTNRRELIPGRRSMDKDKAEHLERLRQARPNAVIKRAEEFLSNGMTMVDTGAHSGFRITIDRRVLIDQRGNAS